MVYVQHKEEKEHPDDFIPKKRKTKRDSEEDLEEMDKVQRPKKGNARIVITWFFIGSFCAVATFVVLGIYAYIQAKDFLQLL